MDLFNNFVLGQDYINGFMLTALIGVNIFLGSLDGIINKQFDVSRFIKGLLKGVGIAFATLFTYLIGNLNPDVLVISAGDTDVNIQTAISLAITAGIIFYGKQVLDKIKNSISGKTEMK